MSSPHRLALVLNAHLPYVRHPEYPRFLEERWLFEAISETYLPLLRMMERLEADGVPFRFSLSVSPTLCEMLGDEFLRNRYVEHLDRLIETAALELDRTTGHPALNRLARMYYDRAIEDRVAFVERFERNLLRAFDFFYKKGRLELLTTAATYAVMPFLDAYPEGMQAQIEVALAVHRRYFGKNPPGFWLPGLVWSARVGECLRTYNFAYTIVDSHGLLFSDPAPDRGTFAPILTSKGLAVFGRDRKSVVEITDPASGIPGAPEYRDFYRDIGWDLSAEELGPMAEPDATRSATGIKYYAVTGPGDEKRYYDPDAAAERLTVDVERFLDARAAALSQAESLTGESAVSVCAYDAELFGHWWFEGTDFLERLFRRAAQRGDISFCTPSEALASDPPRQISEPSFSSGSDDGYAEAWLDGSNDWIYRHVHRGIERMMELAERFPDDGGLKERALNQGARELLLAQSSDWAMMLRNRTSVEYARRRIEESVSAFNTIYDSLGGNYISTEWLTSLEKRHPLFPNLNYRIFRRKR